MRKLFSISVDVPCGRIGRHEVKEYEVTPQQAATNNLREYIKGGSRQVQPGKYKVLVRHDGEGCGLTNEVPVMSNTPAEIADHATFIIRAAGNVVMHGLGLGVALTAILKKKEVGHVLVIEKSPEVIALCAPIYKKDSRVEIIEADALEYRAPKDIDVCWSDIWDYICTDNLPQMAKLRRKYRHAKWHGCWCEEECRREKRKERAQNKILKTFPHAVHVL